LQNLASPSPSSKFQRVFKSLPNLGRKFQYRRYTIGNRSHTLWFSLFFVVARRSSRAPVILVGWFFLPKKKIRMPCAQYVRFYGEAMVPELNQTYTEVSQIQKFLSALSTCDSPRSVFARSNW